MLFFATVLFCMLLWIQYWTFSFSTLFSSLLFLSLSCRRTVNGIHACHGDMLRFVSHYLSFSILIRGLIDAFLCVYSARMSKRKTSERDHNVGCGCPKILPMLSILNRHHYINTEGCFTFQTHANCGLLLILPLFPSI